MKPLDTTQMLNYLSLALGRSGYRLGLAATGGDATGETWTVRRTMRRHGERGVVLASAVAWDTRTIDPALTDTARLLAEQHRAFVISDLMRRCVNAGLIPDPDEARARRG